MVEGDWAEITSAHGRVALMAEVRTDMQPGHLRVPHGWWFPELLTGGDPRGAADQHNDGMLVDDHDEVLDLEQGVPRM